MSTRESKSVSAAPRRGRQRDRRRALLAALRAAGRPLDVAEAAATIGTAESTVRFHLSMLVSAGQVVRTPVRVGSVGRPAWRYEPAAETAGPPDAYQELARVLAGRLEGEAGAAAAARDAGRRWAEAMTSPESAPAPAPDAERAVASLEATLGRLGFAPETNLAGDEILLRACPFEAVAREHRAVVCAVHLGLVEETAASLGGGIGVEALEPFRSNQPLTCAIRLRRDGEIPAHPATEGDT